VDLYQRGDVLLIVYDSKTGNVKRFVAKLGLPCIQLKEDLMVNEKFILITYTIGFGEVPKNVMTFLEKNHQYLIGVAASGNRNWGNNFAVAADIIAAKYNVPIIHKFELSGTKKDVEIFLEEAKKIVAANSKMD
jgi:protein involved in ribonucleotide reduction